MIKFVVFAVVFLLYMCQVSGFPAINITEIEFAASAGNWDEVKRLIASGYEETYMEPLAVDVKSLKPPRGGRVYGESEFTFHSTRSDGSGKVVHQSGGHKIRNDNGKIAEFDFQPTDTPRFPINY